MLLRRTLTCLLAALLLTAPAHAVVPPPTADDSPQNGKVVIFEGDGSVLMHIQELETLQRHGLKCLIIVCPLPG